MTDSLSFWVPTLPWRNLSSNAGARSRRNPWDVAESAGRLKAEVMEVIKQARPTAFERPVVAALTVYHTGKRPKKDQCPRCSRLSGDYPSWAVPEKRETPLSCVEYRPTDVGNIGGSVLKPVLDALVWQEVIADDDWTRLTGVYLTIARVPSLADEGLLLTVSESVAKEAA